MRSCLHTRHLNDFPTPYGLIVLSAIGMAILLYKRIWWPPVLWLVLTVATIYSGAPFRNPLGAAIEGFSQFFYNDPRRLSAVVTMLVDADGGNRDIRLGLSGSGRGQTTGPTAHQAVHPTAGIRVGFGHGGPVGDRHRADGPALLSTDTWSCSATNTTR